MYFGDRSRKRALVEHGFRLPSLDNRPLQFTEFEGREDGLSLSATPGPARVGANRRKWSKQVIRPTGLVDPVIHINRLAGR